MIVPSELWPLQTVVCHSYLAADGEAKLTCLVEIFKDRPVGETLVYSHAQPVEELAEYVANHEADVMANADRRIHLIEAKTHRSDSKWDGLGFRLRDRGYRRGWGMVVADLGPQLAGISEQWAESRKKLGVWSFVLIGLGNGSKVSSAPYRKFPDSPRVIVVPTGDGSMAWWSSTAPITVTQGDTSTLLRPPPKSGPIVDVFNVARALLGAPVNSLAQTCLLFGVEPPLRAGNFIDRLRSETYSVAHLFIAELAAIRKFGVPIAADHLVSTGGLGTCLFNASGLG